MKNFIAFQFISVWLFLQQPALICMTTEFHQWTLTHHLLRTAQAWIPADVLTWHHRESSSSLAPANFISSHLISIYIHLSSLRSPTSKFHTLSLQYFNCPYSGHMQTTSVTSRAPQHLPRCHLQPFFSGPVSLNYITCPLSSTPFPSFLLTLFYLLGQSL